MNTDVHVPAPKILIVKLSSLGDVVQTFPVIADILSVYPKAQIDWVVEEAFAALVARVRGVHRTIAIAQRRWRRMGSCSAQVRREKQSFRRSLRQDTYDCIIDAQGLIKSALVARAARLTARGRRGTFANRSEACGYEWPVRLLLADNQPMPGRIHAVTRARLLASLMLDYEVHAPASVVFASLPGRALEAAVFFAHGTSRADNEWAPQNWTQLAKVLSARGYHIVLSHINEDEMQLCKTLAGLHPNVRVLPRMDLAALLDEMAACSAVVGVDSGLAHLAVALDKPCVQIFQHDRAWRAGPQDKPYQEAVSGGFARVPTPSVEDVLRSFERVMQYAPAT